MVDEHSGLVHLVEVSEDKSLCPRGYKREELIPFDISNGKSFQECKECWRSFPRVLLVDVEVKQPG